MNKYCNPWEWQFGCLVIGDEIGLEIVSGNVDYNFANSLVDLTVRITDKAILKACQND